MANVGLSVSNVVNVTNQLAPIPAGFRNFGAALFLGPTPVIDLVERRREYSGLDGVLEDFAAGTPEASFATTYFAQEPQPDYLQIGRWAQAASSGLVHGASLTPYQQLMTNFTDVTNGSFYVVLDGVQYLVVGLNLSSANNLNGVASLVQQALVNAGAGCTVVWDSVLSRFTVTSSSTGVTSSVSYARAPVAVGTVAFSGQPANNSSLNFGGTAVTFVTGTPAAGQVQIGATLQNTLTSLVYLLNASTDVNVLKFDFFTTGSTLYVQAAAPGPQGAALTFSAGANSKGTASGATLSGGGGTDVSVLLGLSITPNATGANADVPVPGAAAETLESAVSLFGDQYSDWYFLVCGGAAGSPVSDQDHVKVAQYVEGSSLAREYFVTIMNTAAYDPTRQDDLGAVLKSLKLMRTGYQFSSTNPYAVASLVGRCATIDFEGSDTTITLKFKQEPGVQSEYLSQNQWATLKAKNYNVMAAYANGTSILQNGVMANGYFIDEVQGSDWLADYVQTNAYDLLLAAPKVPQTDQGVNTLVTNISDSCQQAIVNGLGAPGGTWNAAGFGTLKQGQVLPLGFYVYAPLVSSQPEADRAVRHAPPIQIAFKFAGAIHDVDVTITYNR